MGHLGSTHSTIKTDYTGTFCSLVRENVTHFLRCYRLSQKSLMAHFSHLLHVTRRTRSSKSPKLSHRPPRRHFMLCSLMYKVELRCSVSPRSAVQLLRTTHKSAKVALLGQTHPILPRKDAPYPRQPRYELAEQQSILPFTGERKGVVRAYVHSPDLAMLIHIEDD